MRFASNTYMHCGSCGKHYRKHSESKITIVRIKRIGENREPIVTKQLEVCVSRRCDTCGTIRRSLYVVNNNDAKNLLTQMCNDYRLLVHKNRINRAVESAIRSDETVVVHEVVDCLNKKG